MYDINIDFHKIERLLLVDNGLAGHSPENGGDSGQKDSESP